MRRLRNGGRVGFVQAQIFAFLFCAAAAIPLPAQTFTNLHIFDGTDGAHPYRAAMIQATDGNLYGTTSGDGAIGLNAGTVFKITPAGTLKTIYNFCSLTACADGGGPAAGLIQATNGNFYGTTSGGGANNAGTVFKLTPGGTLTTLYSFCAQSGCTDGYDPWGLIQGTDGNFYGTTALGGNSPSCPPTACGTVFKITPSGKLTTLHSFCSPSGCAEGGIPQAGLVQATNGSLYGTTSSGGNTGNGAVFKITPSGTLTTLYNFCSQSNCTDGRISLGSLVQASDGNLYGTTSINGANGFGTVFKMTPGGTLTTIYSFCPQSGCPDGTTSAAALIQANDGNLYGITEFGGLSCSAFPGCGTVFQVTTGGTLTTLYSFCFLSDCSDGGLPVSALVQHTNGTLYGTTFGNDVEGGAPFGTVFSESVPGLGPFVEAQTYSGKVGATIGFLGQGFNKSTTVSFNGTLATASVKSGTYLTAKVPSGATTGFVIITTSSGSLQSNKIFRVIP
jgi:uncharacterized repeat protein (TIGR03803 family)